MAHVDQVLRPGEADDRATARQSAAPCLRAAHRRRSPQGRPRAARSVVPCAGGRVDAGGRARSPPRSRPGERRRAAHAADPLAARPGDSRPRGSASTTNGYRQRRRRSPRRTTARRGRRSVASRDQRPGADVRRGRPPSRSGTERSPRDSPPAGAGVRDPDHLRGSGRLGRACRAIGAPSVSAFRVPGARDHRTIGRSSRFGPSGPLSTSWNGTRSSGLSGTPMTDERFVWVSSHHEKPRSSGQRPPSRSVQRLPGPASGIALGRGHASSRARRGTAACSWPRRRARPPAPRAARSCPGTADR